MGSRVLTLHELHSRHRGVCLFCLLCGDLHFLDMRVASGVEFAGRARGARTSGLSEGLCEAPCALVYAQFDVRVRVLQQL